MALWRGQDDYLTYICDEFSRSTGFQIGIVADSTHDYVVRYGYDPGSGVCACADLYGGDGHAGHKFYHAREKGPSP